MKPRYHIANASVQRDWLNHNDRFLRGQITGHPNCTPGGVAHTSLIVQMYPAEDSDVVVEVETENSIYIVDSWEVNPNAPPVS